jgi:hypothetical protein
MPSKRKHRRTRHKPIPAPKLLRPIVAAALDLFPHSFNHQILLTHDEALEYCVAMELSLDKYDVPMLALVKELNRIVPQSEGVGIHHKFKVGRVGSPIIYLWISKVYLPNYDWDAFIPQLDAIAESHQCDSYQLTENTDISFDYLFWWD